MITRAATSADVPAIVELVESAYRGESSRTGWTTEADLLDGQRTDAATVSAAVTGDAVRLLVVADDAGELLACCQVERHGDACHFGLFAVRPSRQGNGVGRTLLAAAEAHARHELRADAMELTVIGQRLDLIAWYERRGYRPTGETRPFPYGDERFGIPRRDDLHFVVMGKRLADGDAHSVRGGDV